LSLNSGHETRAGGRGASTDSFFKTLYREEKKRIGFAKRRLGVVYSGAEEIERGGKPDCKEKSRGESKRTISPRPMNINVDEG